MGRASLKYTTTIFLGVKEVKLCRSFWHQRLNYPGEQSLIKLLIMEIVLMLPGEVLGSQTLPPCMNLDQGIRVRAFGKLKRRLV